MKASLTLAMFLMLAPAAMAQRGGRAAGGNRPPAPVSPPAQSPFVVRPSTLPATPIPPITNPVAPMTNPIMPFIRYGGVPTVVIPSAPSTPQQLPSRGGRVDGPRDNRQERRQERREDRREDRLPIVGGGVYFDPGYFYPYYYPYYPYYPYDPFNPVATPGQLPPTYPAFEPPGVPYPDTAPGAPDPPVPPIPYADAPPATEHFPEPRIILTPEIPALTVTPPAIGTSKADVLARFGEPWGSIRSVAQETLYFRGGLVVVFVDGRVSQIK